MDEFGTRYTDYQLKRSALRKLIRRIYLRNASGMLRGPTLDFGCGVGELLARLPAGSKGLEYNRASVEYCRTRGLDVAWYDGSIDDWSVSVLEAAERFESMVVSHVLEHLESPAEILAKLLQASARLGIKRVLVIVPGRAGFRIDDTHRTFVDADLLFDPSIAEGTSFRPTRQKYFPGNLRAIGDFLPHHELQVLFEKCGP